VRPVNLIPAEQRKGAARAGGAGGAAGTPIGVYALFGALGVALLCVIALVLTTNKINSKTEELSKIQAKEQGTKQVADALRPYGQFAQVQQARQLEIASLASTRFDWERALQQLSLAIPDNVWLLTLSGTLSPKIDVADGGGGAVSNLRQKAEAPAFAITGCTYSQHAVARMMTRMQNLDDVTDVQLAKSARKEDSTMTAGGGNGVTPAADSNAAAQGSSDCVGSSRITKFDLLVVFGAAPSASPAAASSGSAVSGASVPSSTAQNLATANNAAATAQGASAAAGASPAPTGSPSGGN
jgi:Tfp pilus assembly protein PilN